LGHEIGFSVEKGGSARANLLATNTRRRRKLMDAAATRVGASVPLDMRIKEKEKRKLEEEQKQNSLQENNKKQTTGPKSTPLTFLNNNIGRQDLDIEMERLRQLDMEQDSDAEDVDDDHNAGGLVVLNETEDMPILWEEETRKAAFQALYNKEMTRQKEILGDNPAFPSPQRMASDDDRTVTWEDA
jgi:hypothetical protein